MSFDRTNRQFMHRAAGGAAGNNNNNNHEYCHGFLDLNGRWNNGFYCSRSRDIVQYCCGDDFHKYCCDQQQQSSTTSTTTSQQQQQHVLSPVTVAVAVSTIFLLSLITIFIIYRRRHNNNNNNISLKNMLFSRIHYVTNTQQPRVWTTDVTSSRTRCDVTEVSSRPHVAIATVNKLSELLNGWLDVLLTIENGAVTSQLTSLETV